jgi:hypothetical protein
LSSFEQTTARIGAIVYENRMATAGHSILHRDERIKRILANLSPIEMEALYRFYDLEQDSAQIARDLGLSATKLRDLRAGVRKRFLASGYFH